MLYASGDGRRDSCYSLFYRGIDIGAFLAPRACGTIGEVYGWPYGFALAAIGVTAGMIIYALNIGHLPVRAPAGATSDHVPATGRTTATVAAVMALSVFFWVAYEQHDNPQVRGLRDVGTLRTSEERRLGAECVWKRK